MDEEEGVAQWTREHLYVYKQCTLTMVMIVCYGDYLSMCLSLHNDHHNEFKIVLKSISYLIWSYQGVS